jgi:hypothetical protein
MVEERVFGVVVSVPKVITYDCNSPIKNRNVNQPFDATLPFSLTTTDPHTIAIKLGQPAVNLGGSLGGVTNGILKIAGVDINGRVHAALQSAIGPELLQKTLPPDLFRLNPTITHAALFDNGGRMAARVHLSANVPGAVMTDLLKVLVNKPAAVPAAAGSGSSK